MFLYPLEDLEHIDVHIGRLAENFRKKTIFLTGATGFIGKSLVESLVWLNRSRKLDLSIHSISRNPSNFFYQYPHFRNYPEFNLLEGDIRDEDFPFSGVQVDFVIHAATDVVAVSDPTDLFTTCIDGTNNLLNFAKKFNCSDLLLLSSGAIYGQQPPSSLTGFAESDVGGIDLSSPKSAYGLGKQVSEWLVQQARAAIRIKIARCFAFLGPYLPLDQHFAIGNFLQDALLERNIEISGDGSALRTYLYTSDLVLWILKILLAGTNGGVWNVGGSEVVSIGGLAKIVVEEVGSNLKINIQKSPTGNPHRYVPNIKKAANELGLYQTIGLRQAINKTINWNRRHGKYQ